MNTTRIRLTLATLLFLLLLFLANCSNALKETQVKPWTAENLSVMIFRNGDSIPEVTSAEEWIKAGSAGTPAWCSYDNDTLNDKKYGKLYNWFAINDPRGLAPMGWHIPSDSEWTTLTNNFGGELIAGKKMKNNTGWDDLNGKSGNGSNEGGFSALPAGSRHGNGNFVDGTGGYAYWWSSTEYVTGSVWIRYLEYKSDKLFKATYGKKAGFSVRCVRD